MEPENQNQIPTPEMKPNISHAPVASAPMSAKKESGLGSAIAIVVIIGLAMIGL